MMLVRRSAATRGALAGLQVAALLLAAGCQRQDPEAERRALEYLATAAQEEGAVRTGTGLVHKILVPGTGPSPAATDTVQVHYHGTLPDGRVFDSSVDRGQSASFPLDQVIPCWTEGVQRMRVGEKAKLVCPAGLAYGDRGAGGVIPPGSPLVFEVELLGIGAPDGGP
jgi:FKBP-type peptidyl-prolyl cis-trans isomerase FkpA